MVIGRLHHIVVDCPEPRRLAAFYGELLGLPITYESFDWVVIAKDATTSGMAFQRAPDHRSPQWPNPDRPQQIHFDVMVDDLDAAHLQVVALGARPLEHPGSEHVYADEAGHPFCLVRRPTWAPPVLPDRGT
jgi:catechol 2,3-dioxygenase-like lactoylglutathione lyase family enzyme